ncbi:coronin [Elysia marginata]|uniref:Coronin n=1 Tax=Elysia marginata TaxID=1093978 RepID=A0AAV4GW23_9GAST|nr:coronin [Elysia marginata]
MALKIRGSKFRHVYGLTYKREQTFENVRITRNTHDSNFCSVNPRFLAVVTESSGGGSFAVLDVNRPGRVDVNCPRVCGHSGAVLDIKWNPFDDCVIASGSEDATVKIWSVPEHGSFGMLTGWSADLHGHSRRVAYIDWHPTAANVLMSVGFDYKIMVWNVEQAEPITALHGHRDTIYSACWGRDGSLVATTSKDKKVRVLDPRSTQIAMRKNTSPLVMTDLDCTSGILLPYYDPDTRVVYLAGKGDGSIRYFEIVPESNAVQYLNSFQTSLPQRGLGMMPKRGIDSHKNELTRFYKLHASKNLVEPVSMIVPRKAEGFQADIFPPTSSRIPSLSADEWTSGVNRGPILVDLESGSIVDKPRSSMSPAVQPQLAALGHTPHITTYKAVGKSQPSGTFPPPSSIISRTDDRVGLLATSQYPKTSNFNNSNNNNLYSHQPQAYQQQQQQQQASHHPVPFPVQTTTNAAPTDLHASSPPSAEPQSATAKAFNSAQAVFNQSVPLSQPTGSAHQGRAAPPTSLRTAPFSSMQGWSNGRDEGRRPGELGSIKNIKRLSGAPGHEDTDSDSPMSTVSSVSLTNLAHQGHGHRQVSRSIGSSMSLVSPPPPPSPSSGWASRYSNGFPGTGTYTAGSAGSGMLHATSDHPSGQFTDIPAAFSLSNHPRHVSPSPLYDNAPPVTELPGFNPSGLAPFTSVESESYVDTTSTPFKTALASFNQTPDPKAQKTSTACHFPTPIGTSQYPDILGYGSSSHNFQMASVDSPVAMATPTRRGESQNTGESGKTAAQVKFPPGLPSSEPAPRNNLSSGPFRRSSDSSVSGPSSAPTSAVKAIRARPSSARSSAERAGPLQPSIMPTSSPPRFIRLRDITPTSPPPPQRRSLPPITSTPLVAPPGSVYQDSFPAGSMPGRPTPPQSCQTGFSSSPFSDPRPSLGRDARKGFSPTRPSSFPLSSSTSHDKTKGDNWFKRDSPSRQSPARRSMEDSVLSKGNSFTRDKPLAKSFEVSSKKPFPFYDWANDSQSYEVVPRYTGAQQFSDQPFPSHLNPPAEPIPGFSVVSSDDKSQNQSVDDEEFEWPSVSCALAAWEFPNREKPEGERESYFRAGGGENVETRSGGPQGGAGTAEIDRQGMGSNRVYKTSSGILSHDGGGSPSREGRYKNSQSQIGMASSASIVGPWQRGNLIAGTTTPLGASSINSGAIDGKDQDSARKVLLSAAQGGKRLEGGSRVYDRAPGVGSGMKDVSLSKGSGDEPKKSGKSGTGKRSRSYQRAHTIGGVGTSGIGEHISAVRLARDWPPSRPAEDLSLPHRVRRNGE